MEHNTERRHFIKQMGLGAIASLVAADAFASTAPEQLQNYKQSDNPVTVLFQGDSITDGGRWVNSSDWNHIMGQGYAYIVSGQLWFNNIGVPMMFYNRGISGNTVLDLPARWEQDAISIKPDILSIMVGVNDVYGVIKNKNPRSVEQFKSDYQSLLDKTKQELPDTKLVIMEPFVLPVGQVKNDLTRWQNEMAPRQAIVKEMAAQVNAVYIPLQDVFLSACEKAPADYWIWDGIHPMPAGHQLIAQEWIKTVKEQLKFPA